MNFGVIFLKTRLKIWFNGLSFIPKVITVKEQWLLIFDTKIQKTVLRGFELKWQKSLKKNDQVRNVNEFWKILNNFTKSTN